MIHRCRFDEHLGLDDAARAAFARDGVVVIEDFASTASCDALRQRAMELVAERAPTAPGTVFSTHDQRHAKDAYFEASGSDIGVFFEEEAFDAESRLQVPLDRAVNKLGHAMHDLDPVFDAFSHGPRLQAVADAVGLVDARVLQSMYIFKQPGIGSEVVCHQDSTYLHTEPASVVGFWFAIEDAHRGNGCLGGLPGQHRHGLKALFMRQPDGQFAHVPQQPAPQWDMSRLEWLEVTKGTLVVFDGAFPHLSEANRSSQSRHAYTLHAVDGRAYYPPHNWLQRSADSSPLFRGFTRNR